MGIYLYDIISGNYTPLNSKSNNENILQNSEIIGLYKKLDGQLWVTTYYDGLFEIELGIDYRE